MISRRTFVPIGLAVLFAAGAAGAVVAGQEGEEGPVVERVGSWEIRERPGFGLIMSHAIGENRIQYVQEGSPHATPEVPRVAVAATGDGGGCLQEEFVTVGGPPLTAQARRIRLGIEAQAAALDQSCRLSPAENAALIEGFEAAYPRFAARYDRLQTEADQSLAAVIGDMTQATRDAADAASAAAAAMNTDLAAKPRP